MNSYSVNLRNQRIPKSMNTGKNCNKDLGKSSTWIEITINQNGTPLRITFPEKGGDYGHN